MAFLFIAGGLLNVNPGLAAWTVILFLIVMFILKKYAWKPIVSYTQERERTIEDSIKRAENALAEAKQLQADNDKVRREAEIEAQRIVREAREAAESVKTVEVEKTKTQIKQLQEQAQSEIEREKQGALQTLRSEVAGLIVQAAEKVVKQNLDSPKQRELVNSFIDELSKN